MARDIWSVLCQKGIVDRTSNSVSLLEVVEELVGAAPHELWPEVGENLALPNRVHLVSLWIRSDPAIPENAQARFALVTPDGARTLERPLMVDLTQHVRSRFFLGFEMLPYRGPGYYQFVTEQPSAVEGEWRAVAEIPLELRIVEDAVQMAQPINR